MTAPVPTTPGPTTPGRRHRLLLACAVALVLASSCNLPKPPIPTGLPRLGGPVGVVSVGGAADAPRASVPVDC